jgi:hypothetical protein
MCVCGHALGVLLFDGAPTTGTATRSSGGAPPLGCCPTCGLVFGDRAVVVIPIGYIDDVVEPEAERGEAVIWRSVVLEPASDVLVPPDVPFPFPYPLELTGVRRAPAVDE